MLDHHRRSRETPFYWHANDCPLMVVFGSHLRSSTNYKNNNNNKNVQVGPPLPKLSASAHVHPNFAAEPSSELLLRDKNATLLSTKILFADLNIASTLLTRNCSYLFILMLYNQLSFFSKIEAFYCPLWVVPVLSRG